MAKFSTQTQALRSVFWQTGKRSKVYSLFLVLFASLVIAASAQIEVPLVPVPVTLSTLGVLFVGMSLGWRLAGLAVLAYLVEGWLGLPVFAGFSAGFLKMLSPVGGYLWAYLPAAMLAGYLAERGLAQHFIGALLIALLSCGIILVIGTLYLSYLIGFEKAYLLGMQPFFLGELLKSIMLAVIIPRLWRK